MKVIIIIGAVFLIFSFHLPGIGQTTSPDLLLKPWSASWIGAPRPANARPGPGGGGGGFGAPAPPEFAVYHFRKAITLAAKPNSFIVHVSADNRYKLYVNGQQVSQGPAASSPKHWNFETVDLGPYLKNGSNTLAALVWNGGNMAPIMQMSVGRAGFILQGNSAAEEVVNTNDTWKVLKSTAYTPIRANGQAYGYIAIGYTEQVDFTNHPTGWQNEGFTDTEWANAGVIAAGEPLKGARGNGSSNWVLQPSSLPQMEMTIQRLSRVRLDSGATAPKEFLAQATTFTLPANSKTKLLLDQGFLTNAYPFLKFSKGKGTKITLSYAETLYNPTVPGAGVRGGRSKGNRNDIEGKTMVGFHDEIMASGRDNEEYTPLWYRTYRYVQLEVTTGTEPMVIQDFYGMFTGFPFEKKARFFSTDASLDKILEVGWRTARSCAMDTYMDCAYYERLQYIGDARIQAMVSLYYAGDDRLMRQAITQVNHSRSAEGVTDSRYPHNLQQVIPGFSLWWIGMIHDYYWYRTDKEFVKSLLPGIRQVLAYFSSFQKLDGTLEGIPQWKFVDWVYNRPGWGGGNPPLVNNGNSSLFDLQLLWAYQQAAELEAALGAKDLGAQYAASADKLKATIRQKYWSEERKLFADNPDKSFFSQHANSLAILTGIATPQESPAIMATVLKDTSLAPASIYFKYYLHQAATKAGYGNQYVGMLDTWRNHLAAGLTTWGEVTDANTTRSDSHAWGSSPNIELFRILLGIDSDAPGFAKIKIEPHLGTMTKASGEIPHPNGLVSTSYEQIGSAWKIDITIPTKTSGYLLWKGKRYELKEGKNALRI